MIVPRIPEIILRMILPGRPAGVREKPLWDLPDLIGFRTE
jgi:hypothetical protein